MAAVPGGHAPFGAGPRVTREYGAPIGNNWRAFPNVKRKG